MNYTYEIYLQNNGRKHIYRVEDGSHIPMNEDNYDYVDYLIWVAAGNVAPVVNI